MAWLDDNPPASPQFRCPRRDPLSGVIVLHTAESVMDTVGIDTGAENVARFIQTRDTPGSYHDLCDSDSTINLVRYSCEAYQDGTGSNRHALAISAACSYLDWPRMTTARRDAFLNRMVLSAVAMAHEVRRQTGIVVPACRITRAQSEARVPGFIYHADRDPARRKDPGDPQFPIATFLNRYALALNGPPATSAPPPQESDVFMLKHKADARVWLIEPTRMTHITSAANGAEIAAALDIPYNPAEVDTDQFTMLTKDRKRYE
jgi:hypothetical protein